MIKRSLEGPAANNSKKIFMIYLRVTFCVTLFLYNEYIVIEGIEKSNCFFIEVYVFHVEIE